MTYLAENTEELFRFATARAPGAVSLPDHLIELDDDTELPLWLATAADFGGAEELASLEARFDGVDASNVDVLLASVWKFYLQGIASEKADGAQLRQAQQLMGRATLLRSGADAEQVRVAKPVVRLPAAFEEHLRGRRHQSVAALDDDTGARGRHQARLAQLAALEQALLAAIERTAPAEAPAPFSIRITAAVPAEARDSTYHFQPAFDAGQRFRETNDALMQELRAAEIATAGRTAFELLDTVRSQVAQLMRTESTPQAASDPPVSFAIRPVGVADLRVVRQVLTGYEKGELAHIDNVIQGETRERHHSLLQRVEESQSDYSERDSEQYRESQSADRFEMGRFAFESSRQSQDQNSSITTSAVYGEVTVQTSNFMASSQGREESRGEDQRRSREVVERMLAMTRERVGQYRFRNALAEVTETTIHKQKAKCAHVMAQFRWVDKVYQAQVYNYGARAMYEIMLPSPAALYSQLLERHPGVSDHAGKAPVLPALQARDITDSTWAYYAQLYGVDLPAPPVAAMTEYAQASYPSAGHHSPSIGGVFHRSPARELGYQASSAGCSMSWFGPTGQCGITASIGALLFASGPDPDSVIPAQPMSAQATEVTFSASAWGPVERYSVNFYLVWTRTERTVEQWQLACMRIIMESYHAKLAAYREKQAVALAPAQMRAIERTELKRAILDNVHHQAGNSAPAQAKEVRFFEYAFEWDQMTYRFHPYFWGPESGWDAQQLGQQGDSVFNAFLGAGFASVVLPVRRGYEDAAALYLQTGLVLDVAVVPADDTLAAMNREVELINAAGDGGVSEGEPWSYRVPTTLVVLDDGISGPLPRLASV
jgi:hypothetical protein